MMIFLFITMLLAPALITIAGINLLLGTGKSSALLFFIGIAMAIGTIYFGKSNISKISAKQDSINDKTLNKETQIITGNDTIKTYEIVWKQKN